MKSREETLRVFAEQVDRAITVCTRHQYQWGATTVLWEAARQRAGEWLAMAAARRLVQQVHEGDVVAFTAGFIKMPYHAEGEYDGITGAVALARALNIGLGARAIFLTDAPCVGPVRTCLQAATIRVWDETQFDDLPSYLSSTIRVYPIDHDEAKVEAQRLLDKYNIKAVIAVERSDANHLGVHHTGGGNVMDSWTGKVEHLFHAARERGVLTIGMFDVGNEIGASSVRDVAEDLIRPYGKQCRCPCQGGILGATPTDVGVVARSSNAAAYGVAACVAGLLQRENVLHDTYTQRRMMEALMNFPVFDGPTRTNSFTEDGAPGELTLHLIELLHWLVYSSIQGERYVWGERPPIPEQIQTQPEN
ncbi:MAG: DUF4392 domain-containing protein [Verrucomicrobia bacterium]|nr:DUF4392 domain-containing protein [Verrucomicrobiota bacterium]